MHTLFITAYIESSLIGMFHNGVVMKQREQVNMCYQIYQLANELAQWCVLSGDVYKCSTMENIIDSNMNYQIR